MRKKVVLLTAVLAFALAAPAAAELEWDVVKSLALKAKPLDTAVSSDNTRLYVLVEGGEVLVYATGGALLETLVLTKPADGIELSKSGDLLYLTSRERKTVEIVRLAFIQQIGTDGSPVKGADDAPVTVAVFNDFQ